VSIAVNSKTFNSRVELNLSKVNKKVSSTVVLSLRNGECRKYMAKISTSKRKKESKTLFGIIMKRNLK